VPRRERKDRRVIAMNVADRVLPLKTAYTGVSCANCMETRDDLLKCSKCKRVSYCGRECQKADWKTKEHKHECQLLNSFKENYEVLVPGGTLLQKAAAFNGVVEHMMDQGIMPPAATKHWDRSKRFVEYARVCSVCSKSDFELPDDQRWVNCPTCKYGWCCSQEHFDEYKSKHTQEICSQYVRSMDICRFLWNHAKNCNEFFFYTPETGRSEPMERFPASWEEYFQIRCPEMCVFSQQGSLPAEFLPASTNELSQPLTCLYAMYMHEIDDFKDKVTLTVHVVGASFSYEIIPSCVGKKFCTVSRPSRHSAWSS